MVVPGTFAEWSHRATLAIFMVLAAHGNSAPPEDGQFVAWRIVNAEPVEIAWRVRSIQFFSDLACNSPIVSIPNETGTTLATEASDMTGADHAFALRSMRGWESVDACSAGQCYLGFTWFQSASVRCVLLHQGEPGFQANAITLEHKDPNSKDEWRSVVTWTPVEGTKAKLAIACPAAPAVAKAKIGNCDRQGDRDQQCQVTCNEGFGTVEPRLRCIHGAWYMPECLPTGSLIRLVALAPQLIKPYWVVLDAALFSSPDCTDVIRMNGQALSSGEFVIKYANYHPKNVWDSDASTSWASSTPCTPGICYLGFRFRTPPPAVRCVRVEHPSGSQYHATEVAVETLGSTGWERLPDVIVQIHPEPNNEL